MRTEGIPFKETGFFSRLILDYLDQRPELRPFYNRFPTLDAFEDQIREKSERYPEAHRKVLCEVLEAQYASLQPSDSTREHLNNLRHSNTFTVVTGHQLNLFTGPLYFAYKILCAVKLAGTLKSRYPHHNFVPVYWMATEDHDFEEINHFNFRGKDIRWDRQAGGAVGRMQNEGLQAVFEQFSADLGPGVRADDLRDLFEAAYVKHNNLAAATRYLANALFGKYGLVILDADDPRLKTLFIPQMEQDLFDSLAFRTVSKSSEELKALPGEYPVQVNPRELNFFYLQDGLRARLVEENGTFGVLETELRFTENALRDELKKHPERFSPNVITRPLYQEVLLPNLCYIGGGGELAYWLELRDYFSNSNVPFPILLLRNSALLISEKQAGKAARLGLQPADLFMDRSALVDQHVESISEIEIDFSPQRQHLKEQFSNLYKLAEKTDKSFYGAVKAQEVKQLKGLDRLEKRLLKAQKRKLRDEACRVGALKESLFPEGGLQERNRNFAEFYLEIGPDLWDQLLEGFDPLALEFSIFTL